MRGRPVRGTTQTRIVLEAAAAGLAYAAGLCWASVCLVASFRPSELGRPYWHGIQGIHYDTCGIAAFFTLAVCLGTSEYLRLRRRQHAPLTVRPEFLSGFLKPLAQATSETVALLGTGVVVYISVNAVTHPATLQIQATHVAPWPSEGTLRVVALLVGACSVMVLRYVLAVGKGAVRVTEPS
jgi:hypothetical protein